MLSELLQQLWIRVSSAPFGGEYGLRFLFLLSVPAVVLALWRIWTFTISPALKPQEPRETTYWIPYLGHALSLFTDFGGTLARGRRQFGTTPYKLTLGGHKFYVLTDPHDISRTYRNTETLTFDNFMRDMLLRLGASVESIELWVPSSGAQITSHLAGVSNSTHGDYGHFGERLCRQQLLPGKELDILQASLLSRIDKSLQWDRIPEKIVTSFTQSTRTVSLLGWCREVLLDSATWAFFDQRLMQIDPELFESFYIFDELSWQLHFGYPRFLARKMYTAKDRIIDALTVYFRMPKSERPGESWLIGSLEDEMRNLGIGDRDIAAIIMPLYWVINANAYKSCFWTMAYILFDPTLLAALRAEIDPIFATDGPGADNLECRLEKCPLLEAVYLESMRLTASSGTIRAVKQTTDISAHMTLQPGTTIVIPYRELHYNASVFGANADTFDAGRFLHNKDLKRNPSYKPFGGGTTYCPGRYLARREVLTFVAALIHRFDISLNTSSSIPSLSSSPSDSDRISSVEKGGASSTIPGPGRQRFPRINTKKISLALMDPMVGDDVLVDVRPRAAPVI